MSATTPSLEQRQECAKRQRLLFSPPAMVRADGGIVQSYFKTRGHHSRWTKQEILSIKRTIAEFGVGHWDELSRRLPTRSFAELRLQTCLLLGKQNIDDYCEMHWKGDEQDLQVEREKNRKAAESEGLWHGGVWIDSSHGVIVSVSKNAKTLSSSTAPSKPRKRNVEASVPTASDTQVPIASRSASHASPTDFTASPSPIRSKLRSAQSAPSSVTAQSQQPQLPSQLRKRKAEIDVAAPEPQIEQDNSNLAHPSSPGLPPPSHAPVASSYSLYSHPPMMHAPIAASDGFSAHVLFSGSHLQPPNPLSYQNSHSSFSPYPDQQQQFLSDLSFASSFHAPSHSFNPALSSSESSAFLSSHFDLSLYHSLIPPDAIAFEPSASHTSTAASTFSPLMSASMLMSPGAFSAGSSPPLLSSGPLPGSPASLLLASSRSPSVYLEKYLSDSG